MRAGPLGHVGSAVGGALALAELDETCLQRHLTQRGEREIEEQRDPLLQVFGSLHEGALLLGIRSLDRRRILDAPMRGGWVPRPDRAGLAGGAVADREDEIHLR